jgi:hypothetical protein
MERDGGVMRIEKENRREDRGILQQLDSIGKIRVKGK